jgi:hypothetical protein
MCLILSLYSFSQSTLSTTESDLLDVSEDSMSAFTDSSQYSLPLDPVESHFTCKDGSAIVSQSYVNDDFCDCADGTDEPGTAACAGRQQKSTGFACVGETRIIYSSMVNDGVCDCCDGSDELLALRCLDNCKIVREQLVAQAKVEARGKELRLGYVAAGKVHSQTSHVIQNI